MFPHHEDAASAASTGSGLPPSPRPRTAEDVGVLSAALGPANHLPLAHGSTLRPTDDAEVLVRPLSASDLPAFLELIQALADYEQLPGPDAEARERLTADALADPPRFRVLLAERGGRVVSYAVHFDSYSTFLARPTLYIEDIFVLPEERRRGAGRALILELAREAVRRGCGRMEWQVLTWNRPAMAFYERFGAAQLDGWRTYRLTADEFTRLAQEESWVLSPQS